MKNNLLILILLITAGCNLQAMDLERLPAKQQQQKPQVQETCNKPECEKQANAQCKDCGVFYCTAECQTIDWERHAPKCQFIKEGKYSIGKGHSTPQEDEKFKQRVQLMILVQQQQGNLKEAREIAAVASQFSGSKTSKSSIEKALKELVDNLKNADKPHRFCAQCGTGEATKKCTQCLGASYCDKDCQKAHWPTHKAICHQARTKNASKR